MKRLTVARKDPLKFLATSVLLLISCSCVLPITASQGLSCHVQLSTAGTILPCDTTTKKTMEWCTTFVHFDDPTLGTPSDAELAKTLGLTVVRVHTYYQWKLSEPSRGTYDFHHQDRIVANLAQAGLKIILETPQPTPEYIPDWAGNITSDPFGVIDLMVPFVTNLVTRYKGIVGFYQIGNELDWPWEQGGWFTDNVLTYYLNTMINVINGIDPSARTIINCVGMPRPAIAEYFNLINQRGVKYDIIGVQPAVFNQKYISIIGWDYTPNTILPQLFDMVRSFGKPIWISEEYMYPVSEYTGSGHPIEEEIELLQSSVMISKEDPDVTGFSWYPYEQMMYYPWYWYGLVEARGSPTDKNVTSLYWVYKSIISDS